MAAPPNSTPAPDFPLTPVPVSPAVREAIGNAIESLVALLDALEPDPDEEPCITDEPHDGDFDDEGTLGWTNDHQQQGFNCLGEDEPSLGWTDEEARFGCRNNGGDRFHADDREDEHDGREPDVDAEPNGDEQDWSAGIDDEPIFRGYPNSRPAARAALRELRSIRRRAAAQREGRPA